MKLKHKELLSKEIVKVCQRCDKELAGNIAWLELDSQTGRYSQNKDIPIGRSQGWFPFGLICARRQLKEDKPKMGYTEEQMEQMLGKDELKE